jgi:hypothetical protein
MKHVWDEDTQEVPNAQEARGGSFSRGFLIAVPLALALWAVIAWLI